MKSLVKKVVSVALTLLVVISAGVARADGDGDETDHGFIKTPYNARPPVEHHDHITVSKFNLVAEKEGAKARGTAQLDCYSDDKDGLRVDIQGLDPHNVYTVWFTSSLKADAERAGIGAEPYTFRPTGRGNVLYQSPLTSCPLGRWRWLEIREHASGNPKDIEHSVRVLKARLISE